MSEVSFGLYLPIVLLGAAYAALTLAGRVVEGRGDSDAGLSMQTLGFGALLGAGAWCVVAGAIAVAGLPLSSGDLAATVGVVFAFAGLLLGLLFVLFEVRLGGRPVGVYVGSAAAAAVAVVVLLGLL